MRAPAQPGGASLFGDRMFDAEVTDLLALGRACCLKGNYADALGVFEGAFETLASGRGMTVRPEFLSHYGLALAAAGRRTEGRRLCERSIQLEPYEPEHYLNLGLIHKMAGDLGAAFRAFNCGLGIRSDHPVLLAENAKLERRRFQPIPALSRDHLLNRCLGKILSMAGVRR